MLHGLDYAPISPKAAFVSYSLSCHTQPAMRRNTLAIYWS